MNAQGQAISDMLTLGQAANGTGKAPDNIKRRQEFLDAGHHARSESRRHHELRFRARTPDHSCDSPVLGASKGAVHTEGAERVTTGREQLDGVG